MILLIFGSAGVGKNFVGELLARDFAFQFYDADQDLTRDMVTAIRQQQTFTQAMRDDYATSMIKTLQKLSSTLSPQTQTNATARCLQPDVALAQALPKESNRQQILRALPSAKFMYVDASVDITSQRLAQRNDWISLEFAAKIRAVFEPPRLPHVRLDNNGDINHIRQQLQIQLAAWRIIP